MEQYTRHERVKYNRTKFRQASIWNMCIQVTSDGTPSAHSIGCQEQKTQQIHDEGREISRDEQWWIIVAMMNRSPAAAASRIGKMSGVYVGLVRFPPRCRRSVRKRGPSSTRIEDRQASPIDYILSRCIHHFQKCKSSPRCVEKHQNRQAMLSWMINCVVVCFPEADCALRRTQ